MGFEGSQGFCRGFFFAFWWGFGGLLLGLLSDFGLGVRAQEPVLQGAARGSGFRVGVLDGLTSLQL